MVLSNTIPLSSCESFGNEGGILVCDVPPNAEDIPEGTYIGSCGGCKLVDGRGAKILSCSACKDAYGRSSASTMNIDGCKVIGNNNGELVCEEKSNVDVLDEESSAGVTEDLTTNSHMQTDRSADEL